MNIESITNGHNNSAMRHSNCITSFPSPSLPKETVALDAMETQFFERCRRNKTNVSYVHHIPVPQPVINLQRRGLTYQSACGHRLGTPVPILGSNIALPMTTCPVSAHPEMNQAVDSSEPTSILEAGNRYKIFGGQIMAQFSTAARKQRQAMRKELSTIHRQNLQRRLHHRLDVARAEGNTSLIQQLEQEMNLIG